MENGLMTLAQLKEEAQRNLSNYAGEENNYVGYAGEETMQLYDDFTGNLQAVAGGTQNRQFTIQITNANAAVRTAIIFPGLGYVPGAEAQGVIKTGLHGSKESATTDLTTSGAPKTVEKFLSFITKSPGVIKGFKITSTVAAQIEQIVTVIKESPFQDLASEPIPLSSYQDEYGFKDKMVTVVKDIQVDDQTRFEVPISGSSVFTITFFFGPILNQAVNLKRKVSAGVDKAPVAAKAMASLAAASKQLSAK